MTKSGCLPALNIAGSASWILIFELEGLALPIQSCMHQTSMDTVPAVQVHLGAGPTPSGRTPVTGVENKPAAPGVHRSS